MSTALVTRAGKGAPLSAQDHDENILRLYGFPTLAALLANEDRDYAFYAAGATVIVLAEGFRYKVAASDATDHHLITSAGLKLYVLPIGDAYHFNAFNAATDGTTDNYAKLVSVLDALPEHSRLIFAGITYRISEEVDLKKPVHLSGTKGRTKFKYPSGVNGMTGHSAYEEGNDWNAAGSSVEGIAFEGSPPWTGLEGYGLWMRAAMLIRDCSFWYFSGDGVRIEAAVPGEAPGNPSIWGNANGWVIERADFIWNSRDGLSVTGSDVNAGMATGCNFVLNGRIGLRDNSFLGNFYGYCHSATNGLGNSAGNSGGKSSIVTYDGARWAAVYVGDAGNNMSSAQLQALVDTPPGTDSAVWRYHAAGDWTTPEFPEWEPDQPVGTYFLGSGYKLTNNSARTVALMCYTETDQGGSIFDGGNILVLGGIHEIIAKGGQVLGANGGVLKPLGVLASAPGSHLVGINQLPANGDILSTTKTGEGYWRLRWVANGLRFDHDNSDGRVLYRIHGTNTTEQFGTSAPIPYTMQLDRPAIGRRRQLTGTATPTEGPWAKGDIVWNENPSGGGTAGWMCTTAGTDTAAKWSPIALGAEIS